MPRKKKEEVAEVKKPKKTISKIDKVKTIKDNSLPEKKKVVEKPSKINFEKKPEKVEETKIEEPIKPVVQDKKFDYKKYLPYLNIALSVLLIIILVIELTGSSKKYNIADIYPYYEDVSATIKLPKNFYPTSEGNIYSLNDNNMLDLVGAIYTSPASEEDFEEMKESFEEYYEVKEDSIGKFDFMIIHENYNELDYIYYFTLNEGYVYQFVFINMSEAECAKIMKTIK